MRTPKPHQPNYTELLVLIDKLGIDPGIMIDPLSELSFAMARQLCSTCPAKKECRQALCRADATLIAMAPFCPNIATLVGWLSGQSTAPLGSQ